VGFVVPPYKLTNMELFVVAVLVLTVVALFYGYLQGEDSEIGIEINLLKIPYFKLGIHIERYEVHIKETHQTEQQDVFTFSFILIGLQITFFKILEA
jgi:hypothetical protein